jgi:photosystem II stability/assembly factor-like uncharacterized protein
MSWNSSGKIALIGLLATMIASGCGSLPQLSGSSRSGHPANGQLAMRQVGTFTGSVDGQTGQITLQPDPAGSARTRATAYGSADALSLTGTGSVVNGLLRGSVTLTSNNPVGLLDVKAVLLSISNSSVSPNNPTGTTSVSGAPHPYWSYGNVGPTQSPVTRTWEFRNTGGVSFTFRVAIYANTFTYSTADGGTLMASSFISTSTGWAVGDGGKILNTTDGGATWSVQNAGTSSDLKDVSFVSATQGWAVGSNGEIIATSDGGRTWRHQQATATDNNGQPAPVSVNLYGLKFVSATRGIAVGDAQTILVTTNGGSTWTRAFGGSAAGALFDVTFANATSGWAVGAYSTVLHTTDGGMTWTAQTIPSSQRPSVLNQYNILNGVHFLDANTGWAVGVQGWLVTTTDGGATWTKKSSGINNDTTNFHSVFFANSSTGWAIGAIPGGSGQLLKTTNGGTSWTRSSPSGLELFSVTGLAGNTANLWATGRGGLLLYSTNGGSTWTRPGPASTVTYNAVWFTDSAHGWVMGDKGAILRTTNGGSTWISTGGISSTMNDVQFINANEGWAVGEAGRLLHTTDGGATWLSQDWSGLHLDPGAPIPTLYGIRFLDGLSGWACGSSSTLLRTTDGGVTWEDVIPPIQSTYRKIARLDQNQGWIVGSNGVIIATSDGGESWLPVNSGTTKNLNNVDVVPGASGPSVWVVGDQGTVLHSTDGTSWAPVDLGVTVNLNGVDFLPDGSTGWIAGNTAQLDTGENAGLLLRTSDGGVTWERVNAGTSSSLKAIHMLSADEGWVAGIGATLKLFR